MVQLLGFLIALSLVGGLLYVLWRPQWAIVLVVLMFPVEQLLQSYVPVLMTYPWILNVLIGVIALLAVATSFFRQQPVFTNSVNLAAMATLGIFVIATFGLLWTPGKETAVSYMRAGIPYYGLMLVLAPLLMRDLEDFRKILIPIMWLGAIIAVLIMVNPSSSYYSGRLSLDLGMSGDGRGNVLALGHLGGVMVLISVLYRPPRPSVVVTLIRIAAFIIGFGLSIGSGSRGQVLGAIVAGVLFFPISRRLANPKQFALTVVSFGIVVIGFYLVLSMFIGDQNRERWDIWQMIVDITGRFDMVMALLGEFLSNPGYWIFGLGPFSYEPLSNSSATYVHNIAAEILCDEGIVGFILFLLMLWVTYKSGRIVWQAYRSDMIYRQTTAVLGALAAFTLFLALKQGTFLGLPNLMMWCMIIVKVCKTEYQMIERGEVVPEVDETATDSRILYGEEYIESGFEGIDYGDYVTSPR